MRCSGGGYPGRRACLGGRRCVPFVLLTLASFRLRFGLLLSYSRHLFSVAFPILAQLGEAHSALGLELFKLIILLHLGLPSLLPRLRIPRERFLLALQEAPRLLARPCLNIQITL